MPETLHQFMLVTKGYEYLIAVAFLALFVMLWGYLHRPEVQSLAVRAFRLQDIRLPSGLYFHAGHTWLYHPSPSRIRIGLDDFLSLGTGRVGVHVRPKRGQSIEYGEPLLHLNVNGQTLRVPAPVSGTVTAFSRRRLSGGDEAPLKHNWLIEMKPSRWDQEEPGLMSAGDSRTWLIAEFERLRAFLANQLERPALAGATLADGGEPVTGFLLALDDQGWKSFQHEFLGQVK